MRHEGLDRRDFLRQDAPHMDHEAQLTPFRPEDAGLVGIGPRILELRNRRGWNQRELARRAGLRPARLSQLEHGLKPPKLDEFVRLAEGLGVGLEELAFGERQPRSQALHLLQEVERLGTREEMFGLTRLLELLLLGYRAAVGDRRVS
jgi:transcriptional regulator with XRE-family HTH domain